MTKMNKSRRSSLTTFHPTIHPTIHPSILLDVAFQLFLDRPSPALTPLPYLGLLALLPLALMR